MQSIKVGIIGATGYTGVELLRLLYGHPHLEVAYVTARENAGKRLGQAVPVFQGVAPLGDLLLQSFEPADAGHLASELGLEVVFTALPHGASMETVRALYGAGLTVVDLSADFRLRDPALYQAWYGPHQATELLPTAVYGQPELHREELRGARLIAAPGCYPTSAILPMAPLLRAGLVDRAAPLFVDAKSGVSGAGKAPKQSTHYPETGEGMRPYSVAGKHRHTPEIEQELSRVSGSPIQISFTPQLAPMSRGILSTIYAKAAPGVTVEACRKAALELYGDRGLVTVLDEGVLPDTLWVRGSARAHLNYAVDTRVDTVVAFCAIDNLTRGASGQAVQALNVARGWHESLGLPITAQFP